MNTDQHRYSSYLIIANDVRQSVRSVELFLVGTRGRPYISIRFVPGSVEGFIVSLGLSGLLRCSLDLLLA